MVADRPRHTEVPDHDDLPPLVDWSKPAERAATADARTGLTERPDTLDGIPIYDRRVGDSAAGDAPLLRLDEVAREGHLDQPNRSDDVADRYPTRFVDARPGDDAALRAAFADNADPSHWAPLINPRRRESAFDLRPEVEYHTNCCEAARRVQQTLWGEPRTAHGLRRDGLPLAETMDRSTGEHPAYTERWAGKPAETTSTDDLARRLSDPAGLETSAIVFGFRANGPGHAFNARRRADGTVEHIDGQTGTVGDWPPTGIDQYEHLTAIFFTPDDYPHRSRR